MTGSLKLRGAAAVAAVALAASGAAFVFAHGGGVSVRPAEHGSIFELRLPLDQAINADTAAAAVDGELLPAGAPG